MALKNEKVDMWEGIGTDGKTYVVRRYRAITRFLTLEGPKNTRHKSGPPELEDGRILVETDDPKVFSVVDDDGEIRITIRHQRQLM